MVAALVAGLEIDFSKVLITVIHDMDFKYSTTYLFSYLIFHLCRMLECQSGTVIHSIVL